MADVQINPDIERIIVMGKQIPLANGGFFGIRNVTKGGNVIDQLVFDLDGKGITSIINLESVKIPPDRSDTGIAAKDL
jgi:hypothetical protein